MSRHDRFATSTERARKALAYSVARAADAKGAKQERRAARLERVARKGYLASLRLADLLEA